jgi:hypothetical protein
MKVVKFLRNLKCTMPTKDKFLEYLIDFIKTNYNRRERERGVLNSAWEMTHSLLMRSAVYEGVSKSFRTGRLERELQRVQLSTTRCSCIAILWVSQVSFVAITLCVASQLMFIVVSVYFVMPQSGNFWIHPRTVFPVYLLSGRRTAAGLLNASLRAGEAVLFAR